MGLPTTTLSFTMTKAYDAIELPYEHSTLSMLIVMPPRGALPAFQQKLTPTINVNHPFLLFLRDGARGAVLFAGRVSDPTTG
jgi:serine protease inhibitor